MNQGSMRLVHDKGQLATMLVILMIISRGIKETLARRNVANQDAWIVGSMADVTGG